MTVVSGSLCTLITGHASLQDCQDEQKEHFLCTHAQHIYYAALTTPQMQRIGLSAARIRQFFHYCLYLRRGGSSHFAPYKCAAELRRDQSSKGGDPVKKTLYYIWGIGAPFQTSHFFNMPYGRVSIRTNYKSQKA